MGRNTPWLGFLVSGFADVVIIFKQHIQGIGGRQQEHEQPKPGQKRDDQVNKKIAEEGRIFYQSPDHQVVVFIWACRLMTCRTISPRNPTRTTQDKMLAISATRLRVSGEIIGFFLQPVRPFLYFPYSFHSPFLLPKFRYPLNKTRRLTAPWFIKTLQFCR